MTIRPKSTTEAVREAFDEVPSEEAQAQYLKQIRSALGEQLATVDDNLRYINDKFGDLNGVIRDLKAFQAQAEFQIMNLTEQMKTVVESQKREDTEAHKALRRSILALALAEVIRSMGVGPDEFDSPYADWDHACIEVHRRYGGPELGLWLNPPAIPSRETRELVKLFLQRRQEA